MLGSKVLHFFFPEFFPVWDSAWIGKTIRRLSRSDKITLGGAWDFKGRSATAAQQYAEYLDLMFNDVKQTHARTVKKLKRTVVSFSAARNGHNSLNVVIDENLGDSSPILFELCLLGCGRRARVL